MDRSPRSLVALSFALAVVVVPAAAVAQDALVVEQDKVGIGVQLPEQDLHVQGAGAQILVRDTSSTTAQRVMFRLENLHGGTSFQMKNHDSPYNWEFFGSNAFFINNTMNNVIEFQVNHDGEVIVNGDTVHPMPDYVFEPDYELMPLSELERFVRENKHLPNVPSASDIKRDGISLQGFDMALLEKVEELALYLLEQDERLRQQAERPEALEAENRELRAKSGS